MKNKIYLIIIIAVLFLNVLVQSSSNHKQFEQEEGDIESLEKISKTEGEIKITFSQDTMSVANGDGKLLFKKKNIYPGTQQFSEDRRKFIIFGKYENDYPYRVYVYLIDGDKGICRLLSKNWLSAMSDISMKYILWQNNYYDILNLSLYEIESGKTKPLQMQLDNPNILKEGTYTLSIYRSEIKKYDFILKYYYDSLIVAKYGFNVKREIFEKIFDASSMSQTEYLDYEEPSDYELGW